MTKDFHRHNPGAMDHPLWPKNELPQQEIILRCISCYPTLSP